MAKEAVDYFASVGYNCPLNKNPADYFLSLLSADTYAETGNTDKTYEEFNEEMAEKYRQSDRYIKIECNKDAPELTTEYINSRKYTSTWFQQFKILYKRATLNYIRHMYDEVLKMISMIILALLVLTIVYDVYLK